MFRHRWFPAARLAGITTVSLALGISGCSQRQTAQNNAPPEDGAIALPQVVATTGVLCDLAEQVAQDTVELTCLMEPGQDPHTYQAKPSDRQAIDEADLVLYGGYGSTPSIISMVEASSNSAPKVAVYEAAVPEPLMGEGHDHDHAEGDHAHSEDVAAVEDDHDHAEGEDHEHGEDVAAVEDDHTHAEGDDHDHSEDVAVVEDDHAHSEDSHTHAEDTDHGEESQVADPHIWHSARHSGAIANVIATHLAEVNPDQETAYQDNAATLNEQFAQIDAWIQTQVDTIPADSRKLVTTHDAFSYYAEAYGLEVKGALSGISTEEQPSAQTLTRLVDQVKDAQVPAIFAESTTNSDLINTVAKSASVEVAEQPLFVEGPSGAGTAVETMQDMLVVNTCTIVNALGGTCDQESAPS